MAGTITHEWNGTVLTITSDSGTSSMDLKGGQGDIGPRGPQGPAGISIGEGGGSVDLSGYATEDYVDNAIAEAQLGGSDVNLSNYYTKSEVDAKIPDVSDFATDDDVAQAVSGLATETFVTTKIAEAQLSGGDGTGVDLSGYRTLDNNTFDNQITVQNEDNQSITIYPYGIQSSNDNLWIDENGEGYFAELYVGQVNNYQVVATQDYVTKAINNALAALDGDEVSY